MARPKHLLTAAFAALLLAGPAPAQTGGSAPVLTPPGELFAAQPGKFQKLYNDASQCSGHNARLQTNAAVYTARALTESTRARRNGDEQSATNLRALFLNGITIRDSAAGSHQSLEELRAALARRSDVSDASGPAMFNAGGRQVTPLQLETLPPAGPALVQAMIGQADWMLADLDAALACMTAVTDIDVTAP